MPSLPDELVLAATPDFPIAATDLPSSWVPLLQSSLPFAPYTTDGLQYTVYVNYSSKTVAIAFGNTIADTNSNIASSVLENLESASAQLGFIPRVDVDAAKLTLELFQSLQPGFVSSSQPTNPFDGIGPGPQYGSLADYSLFVVGAGLGGSAAEYAVKYVLDNSNIAGAGSQISGVSFGGPALLNAAGYQTVNFTNYVESTDILGNSPTAVFSSLAAGSMPSYFDLVSFMVNSLVKTVMPSYIGQVVLLSPTVQSVINQYLSDLSGILKGTPTPLTYLAGTAIEKLSEEFILGSPITQYANALVQQGSITTNPIANVNPFSSSFNFNLNSAFPGLSGYQEEINIFPPDGTGDDSVWPVDLQTGTLTADGVNQQIAFTTYSDGTTQLTVSEQSPSSSATQDVAFDANGAVVSNQVEFSGLTVTLSGSTDCSLASATDGSLLAIISPDSSDLPNLVIASGPDGSVQFIGGDAGTTPQEILSLTPESLDDSVVNISDAGGTLEISFLTDFGGDTVVDSDYDTPPVAQNFVFGDPNDVLEIDTPGSFFGTIFNFLPGDTLDLEGINNATLAALGAGNMLTIQEAGGGSDSLRLDPTQDLSNVTFATVPNDSGGTDVVETPLAIMSGTQIVTVDAPVTFENQTTTYSAEISLTPINIVFPASRTDGPEPMDVLVTVTVVGGNFDPSNPDSVAVDSVSVSTSAPNFYVPTGLTGLGLDNTLGTLEVTPYFTGAGDYSDQEIQLPVIYDDTSTEIDLTVSGKVYAPAIPEFFVDGTATGDINFGVIHVGQTVSMDVIIANVATGALTDALSSSPGTLGEFSADNGLSNILAGSQGTITVSMTGDFAGSALFTDSNPLFGLTSHDNDLPDEGISLQNVPIITGYVVDYANPVLVDIGLNPGTLTMPDGVNWSLDLGTIALGSPSSVIANIEIANDTTSLAFSDSLVVTDSLSASPNGGFIQAVLSLTGQSAPGGGDSIEVGDFTPDDTALGQHTETIVIHPLSVGSEGTTTLADITLSVTDDVVVNTFDDNNVASGGSNAGSFLWSDGLNWSPAIPIVDADVDVNASGIDDLGGLTVNELTLASGVNLDVAANLNVVGALSMNEASTVGVNATLFVAALSMSLASSVVVGAGATLDIDGPMSGALNGTLQAYGAGAVLEDAAPGDPGEIYQVGNGGRAIFVAPTAPGSELLYDATGSTGAFALTDPNSITATMLDNVAVGDMLELPGATILSASASASGLTVTTDTGTYDFTEVGYQLGVTGYTQGFDASTGLVVLTFANASNPDATALCFLAGTRIATPAGEVPVERLAVGCEVLTLSGAARPIVWIGKGRVLATRGRRNAATPVIVRKGALADNVPHRDLRITKGHAFSIDGVLIPVEFLVNHRSIVWDDHAQEVEVYHIELKTHDVLLANGAPAESYRDDGNRWLFQNANSGWDLPPLAPCAQVLTGGPLVDAVWHRLLERASPTRRVPLTDEPDLHLLIDGRRVDAIERRAGMQVFRLPSRPGTARISSRAAAPQELGVARDPRVLGVAVRQIMATRGVRVRTLEADDARLIDGFHDFEPNDGIRWTNGDAAIPESLFDDFGGPLEITLRLGGRSLYLDDGIARQVA